MLRLKKVSSSTLYFWHGTHSTSHQYALATNLGSHGVFNAHHTEAGESREDVIFIVPVRLIIRGREISVCKADGPQALWSHGLDHFLRHVISIPWPKDLRLTVCCHDFIAPGGGGHTWISVEKWAKTRSARVKKNRRIKEIKELSW